MRRLYRVTRTEITTETRLVSAETDEQARERFEAGGLRERVTTSVTPPEEWIVEEAVRPASQRSLRLLEEVAA